jgi:hypothetical protein
MASIATDGREIPSARYDLAGATMSKMREALRRTQGTPINWWDEFVGATPNPQGLSYRFEADPHLIGGVTPDAAARQVPIFLPGCSQFIVEYAGDFLKQNRDPADITATATADDTSGRYGDVQDVCFEPTPTMLPRPQGTDGEIDFLVDQTTLTRRIRWYGFPRDTDGDGIVRGGPAFPGNANGLVDVVPFRDVFRQQVNGAYGGPIQRAPWERPIFGGITLPVPQRSYYIDPANPTANVQPNEYYLCAWGPNDPKPAMFRITIVLEDPNGRLSQGQTFEFVFKVQ